MQTFYGWPSPRRTERNKQGKQVFFAGVGGNGTGCLPAIIEQGINVIRLQALSDPLGKLPNIGRGLSAVARSYLIIAQIVGDAAGPNDHDPVCGQRCQRLTQPVSLLRPTPALDRERNDRYVSFRVHQAQRHPSTMIQAALLIFCDRQASRCNCFNHYLSAFTAAGGRVTQGIQLIRETVEIVDGFQLVGKTDGGFSGIPMRTDDNNGTWQGSCASRRNHCRTGRTRPQRKGWSSVGNKEGGWCGVHFV